jgi:hypothetical protein
MSPKILSERAQLYPEFRLTDGQTDKTILIVTIRNFAEVSKIDLINRNFITNNNIINRVQKVPHATHRNHNRLFIIIYILFKAKQK